MITINKKFIAKKIPIAVLLTKALEDSDSGIIKRSPHA